MAVYYDFEKGQIVDDEASQLQQQQQMPIGLYPSKQREWQAEQAANQANEQFDNAVGSGGGKPVWAQDAGQFFDELGNILGNAGTGLVTDYLDLAAGLGDVAVQTGSLLSGNGFDTSKIFDDSDNPWTQWRQDNFEAQTKAGEAVSGLIRVGTMLATLPKVGIKGLAIAPRLLSRAPVVGGAAGKAVNALNKADDFLNAGGDAVQAARMAGVASGLEKGSDAAKAANIAKNAMTSGADDWLAMSFRQVAQRGDDAKGWWRGVEDGVRSFGNIPKSRTRIRTVAEALGWDAFVAFNVYGEGDDSFDETLSDGLAGMGINVPLLPQTRLEDSGLDRKIKQMAEGLITGGVVQGLIDMSRVYRFSRAFSKADDAGKAAILEAFGKEADALGRGIGNFIEREERMLANGGADVSGFVGFNPATGNFSDDISDLGYLGKINPRNIDPWKMSPPTAEGLNQGPAQARRTDGMFPSGFANPGPGQLPPQFAGDPWTQGGALATLRNQVDTERIAQNYQRDLDAAYLQANANSPVQNRLAQMDGLASQLDEDPLYQEWLASRAPTEQFMPPQAGDNPALRQFESQGEMPAPSTQGGPGDLNEYAAWLEERARMPEAELDPRVQQSLRRLEGIGELATRQEQGAGQLMAPGGIEPVNVQVIGPRPPEPTVTPQTIRSAFANDLTNALRQAERLTFQEGPDGVMRSIADIRGQVNELMPRTRVDAMQYLMSNPPITNDYGVINAADSVWTNFITNRGLKEGWASIDPDTFEVKFNRKTAFDLDSGDAAVKQASVSDEIAELEQFKEQMSPRSAAANADAVAGQVDQAAADAAAAGDEVLDGVPPVQAEQGAADAAAQMGDQADPAIADAERRLATASVEEAQMDVAEELRLSAAEDMNLANGIDDATVVREYLSTTLDQVPVPEVVKAEVGRGWEVIDSETGELLTSTRTKAAAEKYAAEEIARKQQAMISRARTLETDAKDTPLALQVGNAVTDSRLSGGVTFTNRQFSTLQKLADNIKGSMPEGWADRAGKAWDDIAAATGSKKSIQMTQAEMSDLAMGLRRQIESGLNTKADERLLRNSAEKIETQIKALEPQARAWRLVENMTADAKRFLDHGDFC